MRHVVLPLALLVVLAAPAAAQSLLLDEGETRPFVGAALFTDGEFDGWAGQAGVALKGKADLAIQYDHSRQGDGRTLRTWSPGVRLNALTPTAENSMALLLEFTLTFGRLKHEDPLGGDGAEIKGAGASALFAVVPTGWERKGYIWLGLGVQSLTIGHGVAEAYPVGVGFLRRLAGDLLAEFRLTAVEGEHQFLAGGTWLF